MDVCAIQNNPRQSRALACLTCLTGLFPVGTMFYLRGPGEQQPQQHTSPASFDMGHCRQGGREARFFSFLSLLAPICQRNHKQRTQQFPFPPKEAGESGGSPPPLLCIHSELWISLFSPARLCTTEW